MELISTHDGLLLLAVLLAISVGALLKGITGLGLPLFAVPAIAMQSTVEQAVILMIIPGIASNLWVVINRRTHWRLIRKHGPFLAAGFIGGILGTVLLHAISDRWLKILLATWLAVYLLQYFAGNRNAGLFKGRGALGYIVGLIAGTTQGSSGISAQIVAPYYHGRSLEAAAYGFLVAFSFLLFSTAQMTGALTTNLLTPARLQLSLMALVPTLIFTRIGIGLADTISPRVFNRILLVVFCLMEIKLIADVI
ncbi:MAG: sulfite exporter TauE/SafE family protein [Gammaproteobacteria bacterium]|nr:sulfite exporter TauE/SafE family protein [Gammaproteobacteria bacterium]